MDDARKLRLLKTCVEYLRAERAQWGDRRVQPAPEGDDADEWWRAFRALVNVREPMPAAADFLAAQDELLAGLLRERGVHRPSEAAPSPLDARLALWRGDITTLAADAIVNAANSKMLGCWVPGHHCIDNAIHTYAGVQLRLECARLMDAQGHDEPTGQAKVTGACNLPAKHVVHTVGPIASGRVTAHEEAALASSYASCLDAARAAGCASIAFCCISTGVFGFPAAPAARIAVATCRRWLAEHPGRPMRIIFDVFLESDEAIYRDLLGL